MKAIFEALNDRLNANQLVIQSQQRELEDSRVIVEQLRSDKEKLQNSIISENIKAVAEIQTLKEEIQNLKKISFQKESEALGSFECFLTNLFEDKKIEAIRYLRAAFPMMGLVRAKEIYEKIKNKMN